MDNVEIEGVTDLHLQDEHTVFEITGSDTEDGGEGRRTTGTQTLGCVFLGRLGETIITPHLHLVRLAINDDLIQRLTKHTPQDTQQFLDMVESALCQLDWSEERKLERAMTSFRLTLTDEFMPDLLAQVCQLLNTEQEHHKVQQLARDLLDKYHIKLLGIQAGSLIFILQHSSVEDSERTLSQKERQRELERTLLTLLPEWASSSAEWTVTSYTMSSEKRASEFRMRNAREIYFVHSLQLWEREDSGGFSSGESAPQDRSSLGTSSKLQMRETCEGETQPSMAGKSAPDLTVPSGLEVRDSPVNVTIISAGDSDLREPDHEREQPSSPAGDSGARAEGVGGSGSRLGDPTSLAVIQEEHPAQPVPLLVAGISPEGVPQLPPGKSPVYVQFLQPSVFSPPPEQAWQDKYTGSQAETQETEPEVKATERFQCAQGPDVEVFSLCYVDKDPPRVNVSYERCGTTEDAPAKAFTENGQCVKTSSKVGKVSFRRVAQGQSICPNPRIGRFVTFSKSPSAKHFRLDNNLHGLADVQRVTVTSEDPFTTEVKTDFTINVGPHRSFDVDDTGEYYVVLEERKASTPCRSVRLYRRREPRAVSVYAPSSKEFQPSDLCFYTLRGERVLLITDYLNSSIHVATLNQDRLQFQRHLIVSGPSLTHPTAITVDTKGRLWLACRGGSILTLEQTD